MKKITFKILFLLIVVTVLLNVPSCGAILNGLQDETDTSAVQDPPYFSPLENTDSESETTTQTDVKAPVETEEKTEAETKAPAIEENLEFTSFGNGTCYVSGIGKCKDTCIIIPERSPDGDIVTSIGEKVFYNNKNIKAIQISSTVTSIGNMAFGGCSSLVYISVDSENRAFCDINGVLYSIDLKELIAYPANCGASSIELSKKLSSIADMAFYSCDNLTSIRFGGSLADWGKIDIGEMNYGLYTAALICSEQDK